MVKVRRERTKFETKSLNSQKKELFAINSKCEMTKHKAHVPVFMPTAFFKFPITCGNKASSHKKKMHVDQ